jgi:hypothetical protein
MGFHETLFTLLSGLRRFHVVVATHAPIIISEAARFDPDSSANTVAVLRPAPESRRPGGRPTGEPPVHYDLHTFAEVASHEQLVLRYFQTAPYHAREVSLEVADAVLGVAEGKAASSALQVLHELRSALGLSEEAERQIDSALALVERGLGLTLAGTEAP